MYSGGSFSTEETLRRRTFVTVKNGEGIHSIFGSVMDTFTYFFNLLIVSPLPALFLDFI